MGVGNEPLNRYYCTVWGFFFFYSDKPPLTLPIMEDFLRPSTKVFMEGKELLY